MTLSARFRPRGGLSLWLGAALVATLIAAAVLSLIWTPYPPTAIDIPHKLAPPSAAHWFGTDNLGRDVASQILAGSRISILVGVIAVGIGLAFGIVLGLIAAFSKGLVEDGLMKLSDFVFAFPALLLAIMLTSTFGPGVVNAIIAIGVYNVPIIAKLTRATANGVLSREYALAARAAGRGPIAIAIDHVLPNIAPALIVQATIQFAIAILAEAALSYLGLGAQPPETSWGKMLADAQNVLYNAPRLALYPGIAIALSVLGPQSAWRRVARRARSETEGPKLTCCSRSPSSLSMSRRAGGLQRVVDRTSFSLDEGESLGVVGESGSGKTMTALALMALTPEGARVSGSIRFEGRELIGLDEDGMRQLRGDRIAMIFQEPMTALNPLRRVGAQVAEPLMLHRALSKREAQARAVAVARACAIGRAGTRGAILSVRALRRRTAAGDDRHGDRLYAAPGHCRRADHGARRHGAGAHSRPHRRLARGIEDGDPACQSRSRGDRRTLRPRHRHVRGHDHGERAGRGGVARAQKPLHAGAARGPPATRRAARRSVEDHSRRAAGCAGASRRLPIRWPMRAHHRSSAARRRRPRSPSAPATSPRCHRAGEVGFAVS